MNFIHTFLGWFTDPDVKVRIAVWGASVATLTFIINFIGKPLYTKYQKRISSKVVVELVTKWKIIAPVYFTGVGTPSAVAILELTVTNHSGDVIFITKPGLETSREIDNQDTFYNLDSGYPKRLEDGEEMTVTYTAVQLQNVFSALSDGDNLRAIVTTTKKKTYYSKALTIKSITDFVRTTNEANRRNSAYQS